VRRNIDRPRCHTKTAEEISLNEAARLPMMARSGGSLRRSDTSAIGRIVLQKSFCTGDQKFCGLQARLSCKDVRDLIASRQTHRRLR